MEIDRGTLEIWWNLKIFLGKTHGDLPNLMVDRHVSDWETDVLLCRILLVPFLVGCHIIWSLVGIPLNHPLFNWFSIINHPSYWGTPIHGTRILSGKPLPFVRCWQEMCLPRGEIGIEIEVRRLQGTAGWPQSRSLNVRARRSDSREFRLWFT